ncbi:MAG: YidC/Oxa1 family insertase periplasmic-domain containing protein [Planctomycetota bacterium]
MTKNLVSFIAFALIVIVGWTYLQRQIWPVKPGDGKKALVAQNKDDAKKPVDPKDDVKKHDTKKVDAPEKKTDDKVEPKAEEKKVDPIPAPKEVAAYPLGDENSYLSLLISNRGAGVQKLTMTRFEAADYLGRPAHRQFEFIQDDPYISSFRMYHYPEASADAPKAGLGEALWNLIGDGAEKDGEGWKMSFWTLVPDQQNLKITKTYRLQPKDYHVALNIEIQNLDKGAGKTAFRYQLLGSHGLPVEGEWYTPATSVRNAVVGILDDRDNLIRSIEDSGRISAKKMGEKVPAGNSWLQYGGVMTQYFASVIVVDPKQPAGDWKKGPSIMTSARPTQESTEVKATILNISDGGIIFREAAKDKMTAAKLLPRAQEHLKVLGLKAGSNCVINVGRDMQTGEAIVNWFRLGTTPHGFFDDISVCVNSDTAVIPVGDKVSHNFLLYHGPVKTKLLGQMSKGSEVAPELVDKYTYQLHLNTLTDYPSDSIFGSIASKIGWTFLIISCTKLMHILLYYLHFLSFGSWGFSIILMTMVVRGAMFPISRKQAIMSQKMQALAPEIKKLQERFKDDKPAQAQATMELYRKHKVSPAGGCMPVLLQMPIFMGLYFCLQESVQFRLASFLWIENLAAPDMLFWWGQSIPWISDPDSLGGMLYLGPFFNLLPMVAVGFMILQQKLMTPPAQNEEQEVQQRTMQIMMGVMGIFFYKVAAGLCLYFISSSVWGVIERKLLPKKSILAPEPVVASKGISNSRDRRREREREKELPETTLDKLKAWWLKLLDSAEKK